MKVIFHDIWKLDENQISVSIKIFYWNMATLICLWFAHGCVCATIAEMWWRPSGSQRLKIAYAIWPFTEKVCWLFPKALKRQTHSLNSGCLKTGLIYLKDNESDSDILINTQ